MVYISLNVTSKVGKWPFLHILYMFVIEPWKKKRFATNAIGSQQ
jgi:hypothetical protein